MKCPICGTEDVNIIWDDKIRNGSFGNLTEEPYKMYRCSSCETIWHKNEQNKNNKYYESAEYREDVNGTSEVEIFNGGADAGNNMKFNLAGFDGYRGKVVMDIGCASGNFLDYLKGVADTTIGIEPSRISESI